MIQNKKIAVVVPTYNEELLIGSVIEAMPDFVDFIYIVDDQSQDQTVLRVQEYIETPAYAKKIKIIQHTLNQGAGASIRSGYQAAATDDMDVIAVMDGDGQMDPDDLFSLVLPVVNNEVDYSKGNRLFTGQAWDIMPRYRYLGNAFLSLFTKIASGYWHIADSQTGYRAISKEAIELLPLEKLYPRYGYPNHMLVLLNIYNMRVRDVPVKPVYNIGEKSGIKLSKVIPNLSWLLFNSFLWRMKEKYIIRDFHPLVFFYVLSFLLILTSGALLGRVLWVWLTVGTIPPINALALAFTSVSALQALFFGMWFDMDYNKHLRS